MTQSLKFGLFLWLVGAALGLPRSSASAQETIAVPLVWHDAGQDAALAHEAYVRVTVESANRWFEPAGVCFYVAASGRIDPVRSLEAFKARLPDIDHDVHVGVLPSVTYEGRGVRGVASWRGRKRWVVLDRADAGRLTLAHELGHLFGLGHEEEGVMRSPSNPWGRTDGMTPTQRRTVRDAARALRAEHAHAASQCVRSSIPSLGEIGPRSPLLHDVRDGRYQGTVLFGERHGRGRYAYTSGGHYEGAWVWGRRTGTGTYRFPSGNRYIGDWRGGVRHGQGVFEYANGDRYTGDWRDNQRTGRGVYTYASGDRYEGPFRNGKRHGRGSYTFASGTWVEATYRQDRRIRVHRERRATRVRRSTTRSTTRSTPRSTTRTRTRTCSDGTALRVGDLVRLNVHRAHQGNFNWHARMNAFVGRTGRVRSFSRDRVGCRTARLDVDRGRWSWRTRDLRRVPD
jgi:hypothetical protein